MTDHLPPHSVEAEQGILGCILQDPSEALDVAKEHLTPESFYDERHKALFGAMLDCHADGQQPGTLTVCQRIASRKTADTCGGLAYVSELEGKTASPAQARQWATIVADCHTRRKIIVAAHRMAAEASDMAVEVETAIGNLEASIAAQNRNDHASQDGKQVAREFIDALQDRQARSGELSGVTWGIRHLDDKTDGIQFGEMTILGARPSIGKTAMALSIAHEACIRGNVPTLVVSCEMSNKALMRRLVATVGSVSMQSLRTGQLNEGEMQAIQRAMAKISRAPIWFYDASAGPQIGKITAQIRRHARKHGVKLVLVDYIQKIRSNVKTDKKTYEIGDVSTKLRQAAVVSGVAMVALAQVSRESEKDKGRLPRISDLCDSSEIEKDADCIALLHRPREEKQGEATVIIGKQRDGECGPVKVWYNGTYCRFSEAGSEASSDF